MSASDFPRLDSVAARVAHMAGRTSKTLAEAADSISAAGVDAAQSAGVVLSGVAETAMKGADDASKAISSAAGGAAELVVDGITGVKETAIKVVVDAKEAVEQAAEEQRLAEQETRDGEVKHALEELTEYGTRGFFEALGASPIPMTRENIARIKQAFPIPAEQCVLWGSAEFDLRPSGIVITNKGVFIKSDVGVFESVGFPGAEQKKSILSYFRWDDFDPAWFVGQEANEPLLSMSSDLTEEFLSACRFMHQKSIETQPFMDFRDVFLSGFSEAAANAVAAGAVAPVAKEAWYTDRHAAIHNPAGHGEMTERVLNMLDRAHGHKVTWKGPDNIKNGADRVVDGMDIQVKYYNSARGTLESAFDAKTGEYRYLIDGETPMQLEVPKDQYEKVLDGFKDKIRQGKVKGITDPDRAGEIVRKGKLSYPQARNLTKPGTLESLEYDAATGVVTCTCAMGISFVATAFSTYRQTNDMSKAVQAGALSGTQVFGTTFVQHMLASQLSRTGLSDAIIAPSQMVVQKMGYKATQTIVNGLRSISGKSMIYGAAASNHLAKVLRGNVITSLVTMAVLSVPETYRLVNNKISGSQYAKNMAVLAASIAAGAGGMVAAGAAAGKIGMMAGTTVTPGVGTVVGAVGGFVGGAVGSLAVGTVGKVLHEDDVETASRLFNALVSVMASEYLLDKDETDAVVEALGKVSQREFMTLFESVRSSSEQEATLREFLTPIFDEVVSRRSEFKLPTASQIEEAIEELAEDDIPEHVEVSVGNETIILPAGWACTDDFPKPTDDAKGFAWSDDGIYAVMTAGSIDVEDSLFIVDDVISGVRARLSPDQGLIDVSHGETEAGLSYWTTIIKTRLGHGVQYCLTVQFDAGKTVVFVTVLAEEEGATGTRDAAVFTMLQSQGMLDDGLRGWVTDPVEDAPVDEFPMNLSEQERFDDAFPCHPLSELRKLARFIKENN